MATKQWTTTDGRPVTIEVDDILLEAFKAGEVSPQEFESFLNGLANDTAASRDAAYGEGVERRNFGSDENPDWRYGYPDENVWAREAVVGGTDPEIVAQALAQRRAAAQSDDLPSGFVTSLADGFFWNAADEAMGAADPVAAENMRQTLDQYSQENPLGYLGGQLAGGVMSGYGIAKGIGYAGGKVLQGAQALDRWARGGNAVVRGAKGAAIGVPTSMAQSALSARPGERLEQATDPFAVALGAGVGGALGSFGRRYVPNEIDMPSTRLLENYLQDGGYLPGGSDGLGASRTASGAAAAPGPAPVMRTLTDTEVAALAAKRSGIPTPYGILTGAPAFNERTGVFIDRPLRSAARDMNDNLRQSATDVVQSIGDTPFNQTAAAAQLADRSDMTAREVSQQLGDLRHNFYTEVINPYSINEIDSEPRDIAAAAIKRRLEGGASKPRAYTGITNAANLLERGKANFQGLLDARSQIDTFLAKNHGLRDVNTETAQELRDALTIAIEDQISRTADDPDAAVTLWNQIENSMKAASADRAATGQMARGERNAYNLVSNGLYGGGQAQVEELTRLRQLGGDAYNNTLARVVFDMGFSSDGTFNPAKFADGWQTIPVKNREALFAPDHAAALDDIATLSRRLSTVAPNSTGGVDPDNMAGIAGGILVDPSVVVGLGGLKFLNNRMLARPANAKKLAALLKDLDANKADPRMSQKILGQINRFATSLGVGTGAAVSAYGITDAVDGEE